MIKKYCKYFKQITSENGEMIFGCYCKKKCKGIFLYDCEGCNEKVVEK